MDMLRKRHLIIAHLLAIVTGFFGGSLLLDREWSVSIVVGGVCLAVAGFGLAAIQVTRLLHRQLLLIMILFCLAIGYQLLFVTQLKSGIKQGPMTGQAKVISLPEKIGNRTRFSVYVFDQQKKALLSTFAQPTVRYGDIITLAGNLELPPRFTDFDYRIYLQARGITLLVSDASEITLLHPAQGIDKLIRAIKESRPWFESQVSRAISAPESAIVVGFITGGKSQLSPQLLELFRQSGVIHILTVSGYNVAVLLRVIAGVLRGPLHRKVVFWITCLLAVGYFILTGGGAPILRATLFGLLVVVGELMGRQRHQLLLLLWAAVLMALLNPLIVRYDLSFGLSLLASSGLVLFGPLISLRINQLRGIRYWPLTLRETLSTTISAQLLVLPILAFHFHTVSPLSLITNLLVLWVVPPAMFLGIISGLSVSILPWLGRFLGSVAWLLVHYLKVVVVWLSAFFPWQIPIVLSPLLLLVAYGAVLLLYVSLRSAHQYEKK